MLRLPWFGRKPASEKPDWRVQALKRQHCSVYLKGADLFVVSGAQPDLERSSHDAHPLFKLGRSDPPASIGQAVIESLSAYQRPYEQRELDPKEMYKFLGVRSYAALCRQARLVMLAAGAHDQPISVQGYHAASGGGYESTSEDETVTCTRDPEQLGRAVLALLDRIPVPLAARIDVRVCKIKTKWGGGLAWLAVKTDDVDAVVAALGNNGVRAAVCREKNANPEGSAGVFSPHAGWTLAIGGGVLPDSGNEGFVPFLKAMSIPLGELYYFAAYRIVDYFAWAKVVDGEIVRAFAYLGESGETQLDEGQHTQNEIDLGPEAMEFPDDEVVFKLARAWSVDPAIVVEAVG